MISSIRTSLFPLVASAIFLAVVPTRSALAGSASILYETFGANGVAALDLANPNVSIGNLGISATNIVAGGGTVYIQSGNSIYSSSANLVGLNLVHTNNVAPTGLALDVADNILYETFGAGGVTAIDLANPNVSVGNLGISATNIVYGGGTVYIQSGNSIYSSSANLVGLNLVHTNNAAPTGLALFAPAVVPEPPSLAMTLVGLLGGGLFRKRVKAGRRSC